mmetsp:Transcript_20521/g.42251  ORF Transcript_20521/g.42251 Transcript_20521/m.42251 type:complete len:88 (+) Transcript_20521:353-616(+)
MREGGFHATTRRWKRRSHGGTGLEPQECAPCHLQKRAKGKRTNIYGIIVRVTAPFFKLVVANTSALTTTHTHKKIQQLRMYKQKPNI